jgi:hypothetical protein
MKKINPDEIEMYVVFARLHPVEAFDLSPDDFYEYIKSEGYDLTNEEIQILINESR